MFGNLFVRSDALTRQVSAPVGHQNAIRHQNQTFGAAIMRRSNRLSTIRWMVEFTLALVANLRAFLISRHVLALETVALRQQLAVWKRQQPRPQLNRFDRLFLDCAPSFVGGLVEGSPAG
jgi:hypothetical protein